MITSKFWGIPFALALAILIMGETTRRLLGHILRYVFKLRLWIFFLNLYYFIIVNHREDG